MSGLTKKLPNWVALAVVAAGSVLIVLLALKIKGCIGAQKEVFRKARASDRARVAKEEREDIALQRLITLSHMSRWGDDEQAEAARLMDSLTKAGRTSDFLNDAALYDRIIRLGERWLKEQDQADG